MQVTALLLSNGVVVGSPLFASLDGDAKTACATVGNSCDGADIEVPAVAVHVDQDVRLVLRHRNYLDEMSAEAVPEVDSVREVDFTTVTSVFTPPSSRPWQLFEITVASNRLIWHAYQAPAKIMRFWFRVTQMVMEGCSHWTLPVQQVLVEPSLLAELEDMLLLIPTLKTERNQLSD